MSIDLDTCPKCAHDEAHDGGCWTPGCDCDWDQTTVTREATVIRAADALWGSDAGVMLGNRRQCEDIARVVLAAGGAA